MIYDFVMTDKLAKQYPLAAYCQGRNEIRHKIEQMRQLKQEIDAIAESLLQTHFYDFERSGFEWKRLRDKIDYDFWRVILERGMITNVMTDNARNKFLLELKDHPPDFNAEEVARLAENIKNIYNDNANQMVKEVYSKLIGCKYGDYRNKKIDNLQGIKNSFRCSGNIRFEVYFNQFRYDEFNRYGINFADLLRVCYLLDGRNMGTYAEQFSVYVNEAFKQDKDTVETDYFSIRCYQNGNQLVKWKAEKDYIRERLNQIGGGNGLPDTMSKRYKKEHFS